MVAGVDVGSVSSVAVHGNAVDAALSVDHSVRAAARHDGGHRGRDAAGRRRRHAQAGQRLERPPQAGRADHRHLGPDRVLPTAEHGALLLSRTDAQALNNLVTRWPRSPRASRPRWRRSSTASARSPHRRPAQRRGLPAHRLGQHTVVHPGQPGPAAALGRRQPQHGRHRPGRPRPGPVQPDRQRGRDGEPDQQPGRSGPPALNALLQSLHADLGVVTQHQVDLAEGVSYLGRRSRASRPSPTAAARPKPGPTSSPTRPRSRTRSA